MNGTLPWVEIASLTRLQSLNLRSAYNLHGTLPAFIGHESKSSLLTSLEWVQMYSSQIGGSIPESWTKLTKLSLLWMFQNKFTGSIPSNMFQELTDLWAFNFAGNFLTGTIPSFLNKDHRLLLEPELELERFRMGDNMLTGTIPEDLYDITALEDISLWNNHLSGTLSSQIGMLTNLDKSFDIRLNEVDGTLPTTLGLLSNLRLLEMHSNHFYGRLPSELGLLTRLESLTLNTNELSGLIPSELASLTSAVKIELQFNNLTGDLNTFCDNNPQVLTQIAADCAGSNQAQPPLVDCRCCITCCSQDISNVTNSSSGSDNKYGATTCTTEIDAVCQVESSTFMNVEGSSYVDGANTSCDCIVDDGGGSSSISSSSNNNNNNSSSSSNSSTSLSCVDDCEICDHNRTLCAINTGYGFQFEEETGFKNYFTSTYQYTKGRNETVTFEYFDGGFDTSEWSCHIRINGKLCNSCTHVNCEGNFPAYDVRCENVLGDDVDDILSSVSSCELHDEPNIDGPLAIFVFQQPNWRVGCAPRFYWRQS